MSNLMQSAMPWLRSAARTAAGVSVDYHGEGGDRATGIPATVTSSTFQLEDDGQIVGQFQSRDYLITVADLVLAGKPYLPRVRDRIHETIGGILHVFEVLSPGNEQHFRYHDNAHTVFRIHTKKVG